MTDIAYGLTPAAPRKTKRSRFAGWPTPWPDHQANVDRYATLQISAEGLSAMGVPVFAADIKGDLRHLAAGQPSDALLARAKDRLDDGFAATPTICWDLFGKQGHPIRTTISEMGPLLLSRLMGLTEAQEGALNIAFRTAEEEGLLLLDLPDLRSLLSDLRCPQPSPPITEMFRPRPPSADPAPPRGSRGAGRRQLLRRAGARYFTIFMRTTRDGRGYVNILAADKLMGSPQLYATFLLWLLSRSSRTCRRSGTRKAEARLLLRRGASPLHRCTARARPENRAGGALEPLQGRRRLFRHPESARCSETVLAQFGNKIQHALQRLHPTRPEGGEGGRHHLPRQNPAFAPSRQSPSWPRARRWSRCSISRACRPWWSAPMISPRRAAWVRSPSRAPSTIKQSPIYGLYDETVNRESASMRNWPPRPRPATTRRQRLPPRSRQPRSPPARRARTGSGARARNRVRALRQERRRSVGRQVGSMVVRNLGDVLVRGILGSLTRR